jgi:myo-inositol-1(or 4)-monophosphatase
MSLQYEQYFQTALTIVSAAGQIISEAQSRTRDIIISTKAVNDIVTNIDVLVEDYILQELKKHFPHHKILSEESGLSGDLNSDYLWILDPIDGTKNFARRNPHCCISLALQCKHGDIFETIIGIIYQPATHSIFTAIKGQGAYLNNNFLTASAITDLEQAVICLGYGYLSATPTNPYRFRNMNFITEMSSFRVLGATALDLAYAAAGILDGLFVMHTPKIWDIAAGLIIATEAGCVVCDAITGQKHQGIPDGPFIVGNPQIAESIFKRYNHHSNEPHSK